MYCTSCGTRHEDVAKVCANCGSALPGISPTPTVVPNYLVFAVLVTLCCCVPLGIPALVYSAQVSSRLAGGDVGGAMRCSRLARLWCWAALASGVILAGLYFLLMVAGAALD